MSAILGRMVVRKEGPIVNEYLRRDEALFAEQEWSWTTDRDAAFRFEFQSFEEEMATIERHTEMVEERPARPWAINLPRAVKRSQREPDCGQDGLSGRDGLNGQDAHVCIRSQAKEAAVPAAPVKRKTITERIHQAKSNRRKADKESTSNVQRPTSNVQVPRSRGADAWRDVYQSRVSPEESFRELERRHLD